MDSKALRLVPWPSGSEKENLKSKTVWPADCLGRCPARRRPGGLATGSPDLLDARLGEADHRPAAVGIQFVFLQENIDTTSTAGNLIFRLCVDLAKFAWDLIREWVQTGLATARVRGRKGQIPVREIARILDISRVTLYRYL